MTKKSILWISLGYAVCLVGLFLISLICHSSWCKIHDDDFIGIVLIVFSPLLPTFLFSLITYRMNDSVFLAWRNFSYWFIPLTIFLVLITPEGNSVIMSWGKEVPAIGMSIFYVLISAIIVIRTWWKTRKGITPIV